MQTPLHGGRSGGPLLHFQIVFQRKITVQMEIQKEPTTPVLPPEVFALTWHADVGHIMHMAPHIAYVIHLICHQLSLDFLCVNATYLVSISYM